MNRALLCAALTVASLAAGGCGQAARDDGPGRWVMMDVGPMGAWFLDRESIGRTREPETLGLLDVIAYPGTGAISYAPKTYALWCRSRETTLRPYTVHYEDGRTRQGDPPPEHLIRHPVAEEDLPGGSGKHGPGPTRSLPSRLAGIVCDRTPLPDSSVDDPVAWVRSNLSEKARSFR